MGFEMIKEDDNHCVIKNVAKGIEEEFDVIFNRLIWTVVEFNKELSEVIKERNLEKVSEVINRDKQLTRFVLFSKRMLNKIGYKNDIKTRGMYSYCTLLEIASDDLKAVCIALLENKNLFGKDL